MGHSSLDSPTSIMKMISFAVLALAAVAFAEPEPQFVYSGVPVSTVYNNALTYSSPLLRSFTPYTTYNGLYRTPVVHSIGKRDADADPATVYTTGVPVSTYGAVHHVAGVNNVVAPIAAVSPVSTYSAVRPVSTYSAVSPVATYSAVNPVVSPVTYSAVNHVAAPVSTYVAAPVTHSVTSYNNPSHYTAVSNGAFGPKYIAKNHGVEHVVKRDAEPRVSLYSVPVTHAGVVSPVVYNAGHVVKGAYAPHAVAATPFGYTHSSNVGVCTNHVGVQVPC